MIVEDNGLQIASLLELAAAKVRVVQVRAEAKDYIDIDALVTDGGVDLSTARSTRSCTPGLSTHIHGPTGIPSWGGIPHRQCRDEIWAKVIKCVQHMFCLHTGAKCYRALGRRRFGSSRNDPVPIPNSDT
jgi:hypothetical protein